MKLKTSLLVIGLALLASITVQAVPQPGYISAYAGNGTAVNSGTNWCVIPAESAGTSAGTPLITYLNVNANSTATITLQEYLCTNSPAGATTYFVQTNLPGLNTTNYVGSTNGITVPCWAVVHHVGLPYVIEDEAVYITTLQLTNQIVFQNAPLQTVQTGDALYIEQYAGPSIPIAAGTTPTSIGPAGAVLTGAGDMPLLLVIQSGSTAGTNKINAATATFVAP